MSTASSLRNFPVAEHINLVDEERRREAADDAEQASGSEAPTAPSTPGPAQLSKRLTNNSLQLQQSLKREWTRRKYAKYDRGRYKINEDEPQPNPISPPSGSATDPNSRPALGDPATAPQTSYLERSRLAAKSILKRKRTLGAGVHSRDSVLDILYENQRGFFFLGTPRYSSSTLLPSDPKPWQNAQFRTSPSDIRNAQLPDPSWEWVWKSWYVDMSRDVDEEGWEYSFQFGNGFAWHGSHPWFHSFVRRRRWVRLRRKREGVHRTKEKAHELTEEYFTIHPKTVRRGMDDISTMAESELARMLREKEDEVANVDNMEISDIASLIAALKKAPVDREKLVAVRKFITDATGDELYYLSDRMEEIMSLFIFQSSRKQLLTDLLQRHDEISKQKKDLTAHSYSGEDEAGQREHKFAEKRAEYLMKAVHAADEQVKKLEYWSDIKGMAQHGNTLLDSEGGQWDGQKWQGLAGPSSPKSDEHPVESFASKQGAEEGVEELHKHAEHGERSGGVKNKESSSIFYDAKTQTKESSEDTQGAYSTAAESVSQMNKRRVTVTPSKGKAPVSLDGMMEGEATGNSEMIDADAQTEDGTLDPDTGLAFMTPPERPSKQDVVDPKTPSRSLGERGVKLVDPVAEPDETEDLPSPALKGEGS